MRQNVEKCAIFILHNIQKVFITSAFVQIGVYWYWSSGEEVSYTNWGEFEPSENILNSDEGCVYMDTSGFWHDDSCSNEYAFICKHYGKEIFLNKCHVHQVLLMAFHSIFKWILL